ALVRRRLFHILFTTFLCYLILMFFLAFSFFFFTDTATTEIYTLSLHDALPILEQALKHAVVPQRVHHGPHAQRGQQPHSPVPPRSEEHTSELQSHLNLVCRLLLEKKKKNNTTQRPYNKHRSHSHLTHNHKLHTH